MEHFSGRTGVSLAAEVVLFLFTAAHILCSTELDPFRYLTWILGKKDRSAVKQSGLKVVFGLGSRMGIATKRSKGRSPLFGAQRRKLRRAHFIHGKAHV